MMIREDKKSNFSLMYEKDIHKKLKKKIMDRKRAIRKMTSSDFAEK